MFNYLSKTLCLGTSLRPGLLFEKRTVWAYTLKFTFSSDKNFKEPTGQEVYLAKGESRKDMENQKMLRLLLIQIRQQQLAIKENLKNIQWELQQSRTSQLQAQKKQMDRRLNKEIEDMKELKKLKKQVFSKLQIFEEELQNNRSKQILSMLSGFFILFGLLYYHFRDNIDQKCLTNRLKNKVEKIKESYVDSSPIYEELKKIVQENYSNRIKLVVGSPGLGKTISLKKLLEQKAEKGEIVYYYTFQSGLDNSKLILDRLKQVQNLFKGVASKYSGKQYEGKKVKVVIDDINIIQDFSREVFYGFMSMAQYFGDNKYVDLILISSSQSFADLVIHKNSFNKAGQLHILQTQPTKEFITKLFMKKVSQQKFYDLVEDKSVWTQAADFVFQANFTPRMIKNIIIEKIPLMNIQKMTKPQIMQELKRLQQKDIETLQVQIQNSMKEMEDPKQKHRLIRLILEQTKFKPSNCTGINCQFAGRASNRIIQELKKNDLIAFCKPKTRRERAAFEEYLNKGK